MQKVYDVLNFQDEVSLPPTQTNNSLLKYIKKQEYEYYLHLLECNWLRTNASKQHSRKKAQCGQMICRKLIKRMIFQKLKYLIINEAFLNGRTRELIVRTSHENKRRISNIMLRLEENQKELVARHKCYVNELKFKSFNKEIQNQELEHFITLGSNDNPNLNIKLISSKIPQSGRNSSQQNRQTFKQLNLQQVKEKIVLDMLRKDVDCRSDPLRLQFFNLYRIIMQNRTIKSSKEKEVMEIVSKSDQQRKETIFEKRQMLNPNKMRFTFREKESQRSFLNRSLDERINKNTLQKRNFCKLLEYLKQSQIIITQGGKEQLECLRAKLLKQQILTIRDIKFFERTALFELLIQFLKL